MKLDEPVTGGPCWTERGTGDRWALLDRAGDRRPGGGEAVLHRAVRPAPGAVSLARLLGRPGAPDLGFPHDFLREPVIPRNGTERVQARWVEIRDPRTTAPAGAVVPFPSASRSRPPRDDVS
ncbi:hypothetical protein OG272_04350 [Streptomyces sp. NBC_00104]|uniref:hypothetical protein n=1 Tax=Streptomyces sp. NBC_00104 TaxID=2903621 RepID=UPI003252AF5B